MKLTWQIAAIASAFFFACTDITIKHLTDMGLSAMDVISMLGLLYGIFAATYLIKYKNYKRFMFPKYSAVFVLLFLLVIMHLLADYFFDTALIQSPNPGYVTSCLSLTIILVYLYSICFMKAEINIYSVVGIALIILGIYFVTALSGQIK